MPKCQGKYHPDRQKCEQAVLFSNNLGDKFLTKVTQISVDV